LKKKAPFLPPNIQKGGRMESFKESTYWQIWADCCTLHKSFYGIDENDTAAWEQLFKKSEDFGKKYAATPEKEFAQNLILLVVNEIEEKSKGEI
jgi:hypothetical protein